MMMIHTLDICIKTVMYVYFCYFMHGDPPLSPYWFQHTYLLLLLICNFTSKPISRPLHIFCRVLESENLMVLSGNTC